MKKIFSLLLIILSVLVLSACTNSIVINRYGAVIMLDDNGDMNVIEQWRMVYNEELSVRFRDIDYNKYPDNYPLYEDVLNQARFDESSASVTIIKDYSNITNDIDIGYSFNNDYDELGERVACEPVRMQCESIFTDFNGAGGLVGNVDFIYEYTITGAVTEYSDISELNWVLFDYAESKVDEGEIVIILPSNSNNVSDYHIWSNSIDNVSLSVVSNEVIKILFEDMGTNDILDFRLLVPTSTFNNISESNKVINAEINKQVILDYEQDIIEHNEQGEYIETLYYYIPFLVALIILLIAYLLNQIFFKPFITNFTEDIYRELPSNHSPAVTGYLYRYKKTTKEDITATVLDLVRRDFLSLDDSLAYESPDDFDLIIILNQDKNLDELLPHEAYLIEWFIGLGDGKQVTTAQIEEYGKTPSEGRAFMGKVNRFKHLVKYEAMKHHFFDSTLDKKKNISYIFALIPGALFLSCLVLNGMYSINVIIGFGVSIILTISFILFIYTRKRRSEKGQELFNKWKAYNNYLLESDELKTYNMSSVEFWEHNLIYATTFGFADEVMEQLSIKLPMNDEIARESKYLGVGYKHSNYRYGYFIHSINHSYNTAYRKSSIISRPVSSGKSGGFSGGSFGGGGGGGRSR